MVYFNTSFNPLAGWDAQFLYDGRTYSYSFSSGIDCLDYQTYTGQKSNLKNFTTNILKKEYFNEFKNKTNPDNIVCR